MTRLNTEDIQGLSTGLLAYDVRLKEKFGFTLMDIAKKALKFSDFCENMHLKTAVVPVTSGLGIINGFSQAVCDILKYCGCNAFVTDLADVAGLQEAYQKEADLFFMADDLVCAAFSMKGKISSDNGVATGIAFSAALHMIAENIDGKEILILGAGPVGVAASMYISGNGGVPVICDLNIEKATEAANQIPHAIIEKSLQNIRKYQYIIDATNSEGFITREDITEGTIISAPGIPLGFTKEVRDEAIIFHNPLELGILTMYLDCICQLNGKEKAHE